MNSDNTASILVVDDEPDLRTLYELTLLRVGHRVVAAGTVAEAWDLLQTQRFDVVITDMRLPDGMGLELLTRLREHAPERSERCVVITAYGSAENAVECLKAGAFDYLTKPVDLKQFRAVIASAIHGKLPKPERRREPSTGSAVDKLVGNSTAMTQVKARIARVAPSMAPVLVRGESGTGKELVARAIHASSHRAEGPFIAVNCSAIPENLLEAEFFGAKKGSYTGATHDRLGYFQAARSGSLFLDEIGDLPLAMQSKLLRAIQERSVRALGSTQEEEVDVRIISATHKDLSHEVEHGQFRQDLYYRLNVIEIYIPPLRERREDLGPLCQALIEKIDGPNACQRVTPTLLAQLVAHPLRGNVRELENLLHRALALSEGTALELHEDTPVARHKPAAAETEVPSDLQAHLDKQERDILLRVLKETQFNRTAAAARLKISLRQIRYRMERLNIAQSQEAQEADDGL